MITCPKCHHVRDERDTRTPEGRCPSCGIYYAKARDSRSSGFDSTLRAPRSRHAPFKPERRITLGRVLALGAIGWGAYLGIRTSLRRNAGEGDGDALSARAAVSSLATRVGSGSSSELQTLAASTSADDVTIYTTSWCPNCRNAMQWMRQAGFALRECDVERDPSCTAQWQTLDGRGVPVLVVRGHVMKDGFDSQEFVAASKRNVRGG